MLVDDFLPTYDVSDAVATVVHADVATTWDALMEGDLIAVGRKRPLVGVLGAIRVLPDIVSQMLHGELLQRPSQHLRLRDTTSISLDKGGYACCTSANENRSTCARIRRACANAYDSLRAGRLNGRAVVIPGTRAA